MNQVPQAVSTNTPVSLPDVPVLCANARQAAILTTEGEIRVVNHETAKQIIHKKPVLVCHAPYTRRQLGIEDILSFDILELFAFVHPTKFCVPTPFGIAKALGINLPEGFDEHPIALMEAAKALLTDLRSDIWQAKANPLHIANAMGQQGKGWNWTPLSFLRLVKLMICAFLSLVKPI